MDFIVQSPSCVHLFATPWTVACQATLLYIYFVCVCVCVCVCICIYIYVCVCVCVCIYIYLYRLSRPKAEYTFFSSAQGTVSRIDHMLNLKTSLDKFMKIEIILSIFSNSNALKLESDYNF